MRVVRLRSLGRRLVETGMALILPGGRNVAPIIWSVEGYLFPQEGAFLHQIARHAASGGAIVEIGSMRGLSTCCLATGVRAAKPQGRVVAIDPHLYGSEPELRYNLERLELDRFVDVRVARAEDVAAAWREELSAVFIDGAHDVERAARDFETWSERVRPGGFVLIHDSTPLSKFPGPSLIADMQLKVGPRFDAVGRVGSISWGRVPGGPGWSPSLRGAGLLDAVFPQNQPWK
jgi:hypothetical protein